MKIAVLGSGAVGQTLAKGLRTHGYDVRIASRSADKLADFAASTGIAADPFAGAAAWGEALVLAVKGTAAEAALSDAGRPNVAGKIVIDTTNPIAPEPPEDGVLRFFTGPNDSLMERLQAAFPDVRFVKAFNTVGNALMINPHVACGPPTMFYCGNDAEAKRVVARIIDAFGWEGADMGTAKAARSLEALSQLWCIPGLRDNQWRHAFKLVR
jgi:predicted dinucleotide-binding enzyme